MPKKVADPSRAERALKTIDAQIAKGTVRVYRNVLKQPYVFCDCPGFPAIHEQLYHKDVTEWLCRFVWEKRGILLKPAEVNRLLPVLAGKSWDTPVCRVTDTALLQEIEQEPLLLVVMEFMHTRDEHEERAEPLWKHLRKFARGRRILVRGKRRFPGGPNVLTRKLALYKGTLAVLGIGVDIKRSNGSIVTLTRKADDPYFGPSAGSSKGKPRGRKELPPEDAGKRLIDKLAAKRKKSNKNENERKKP